MSDSAKLEYPCTLTIYVPFPTHRLAQAAVGTLSVDQELSQLVTRSFSLVGAVPENASSITNDTIHASITSGSITAANTNSSAAISDSSFAHQSMSGYDSGATVLKTEYRATTNRMLRVAVNGFFESLNVIIQVMEELDTDVLHEKGIDGLEGVQGVEQGMTGTTLTGA